MAKQSAGILLFRERDHKLEVLLVHPGGPYWVGKDLGAWSIPKGEFTDAEAPLDAARREFAEETGTPVDGRFLALTPVRQRGGKLVHAWALRGDLDPQTLHSNTFTLQWPPRSGRELTFPEVDRAAWFDLATARTKINSGQAPLLDELSERAGAGLLDETLP